MREMDKDFVFPIIMLFFCIGGLFLIYFLLTDSQEKANNWLEEKICKTNGYDEHRYLTKLGNACIKFEPEPIAHLIDCEVYNKSFLFYFGARPENCILLKEIVVVS